MTFVLLAGAALLGRSFVRLLDVDPGFQARNVALFELHVWSAYPQPEAQALFFRDTLDRVRDFPGVLAAGAVSAPPFLGGPSIEIETDVTAPGTSRDARPAWLTFATPGYFDTMQIPVRDGRTFAAEDRAGHPPVAIISEGLAARLFDGRALGRQIVVGNERTPAPLEVVGVVASLRHVGLDSAPRDEIFVPVAQAPFGSMNVVVRTNGDPSASVAGLADRIRAPAPAVTISGVTLLDDLVNETIRPRRFYLAMASWLAGTALVLAAVGLYGLISFLVTLRTREMGLRMALGGGRGHVLRLVLATAAMPAIAGIVAGGAGALVGAGWLRAGLYGVAPTDPLTFAGAAVALLGVAVAAAVVPARRALRVDPVTALRDE